MKMNKKASLNMAIEVIVIVVIAMTLLGLGLGFIKSQFSGITSIGTEVTEQVREQITGQLRTSGAKMSFPRTVQMARGERKVLTVGVQNTGTDRIWFGFEVTLVDPPSEAPDNPQSDHELDDYDIRYSSDPCSFFLEPSEADAYGINVKAPNTAGTDTAIISVISKPALEGGECDEDAEAKEFSKTTSFITVG
jgi:hypothetical protein